MSVPLKADVARVLGAVTEDAREAHRLAFGLGDIPMDGHTALTEEPLDGRDVACMKCGHINEAEYLVGELLDEPGVVASTWEVEVDVRYTVTVVTDTEEDAEDLGRDALGEAIERIRAKFEDDTNIDINGLSDQTASVRRTA